MGKAIGKVASKYARALLRSVESESAASGDGKTPAQQLAEKLTAFSLAFGTDRDLHNALLSPMFPEPQRAAALNALTTSFEFTPTAKNFIKLMFERGRLSLLSEVALAFTQMADRAAKVVMVEVLTARPVGEDEQAQIAASLKHTIVGKLEFTWSVDPEILGGMLVRYDGFILDGTVRSNLNRVGQSLIQ
jgi:F-type H+-transporting ATPase subunit delta